MTRTRTLIRPPRMLYLYARAAASLVPGASITPGLGPGSGPIPDLALKLAGVHAEPRRLEAYRALCAFPADGQLPVTYPHILAFGLHMRLLTDPRFPYPAVGLVHIENSITRHRQIPDTERLTLSVRCTGAQQHPRGQKFSLITEATIAGEPVWESTSTMLRREPGPDRASDTPDREPREPAPGGRASTWSLQRDLGRRYAAVSGDRNPIHTHPLAARAFGFPGPIAHGAWTKARALAALHHELSSDCHVQVSFRRPIVLPATVALTSHRAAGETTFAVRDALRDTNHLDGHLSSIPRASDQPTKERPR